MAAPEHVPSDLSARPRTGLGLPPARPFDNDRPGALGPSQPTGPGFGNPGPDQGYALRLAERFAGRLVLATGEVEHDVITGCTGVALRRASLFGRAPVIHDLTVAFTIWGFLGDAPPDLVALRTPLFQAASHHYEDQRAIVDMVPEATLRLPHGEVARRFPTDWRSLLGR
ncbi:MAG: hypothetical protein AVDCRST_MAG20-2905 [uncultured Acidimicrobiales bacterium]|uniref:Uncharacterized protein n=1 Tax=uncultured Acidimicrobiales bacterium TaxID=310071 RepID=A0A6J4IVG2_9ACTN|nr:MAG: hypothetical protein AVDCRST_MAG20-2905 [uncultured Acidimicrobiales bacterium]